MNIRSLYRLSDEHRSLERLDLRVAGMICHVCQLPLSELIAFEIPNGKLRRLSAAKQRRLDELMHKNNQGRLRNSEREELRERVHEAEQLTISNARHLARDGRPLAKPN